MYLSWSIVGARRDTKLAYQAYRTAIHFYSAVATRRIHNTLFKDFLGFIIITVFRIP